MAAKKELGVERTPQPRISVDEDFEHYRQRIVREYNEQEPEALYSWQRGDAKQALLERQGQVVVKDEKGREIQDAMGDVLVKQDRAALEDKLLRQQERSLDAIAGIVASPGEDGLEIEADLLQVASPKQISKVRRKTRLNR